MLIMKVDSRKFFIFIVSSAISQHVLATGDNTIRVSKCKRGVMSEIDLNIVPRILPEELNSIDTSHGHQKDVLSGPDIGGESMDLSNGNPPNIDQQTFSDKRSSCQISSNLSSNIQKPDTSRKKRKSNPQDVLCRNSLTSTVSNQKTKPLEEIHKSDEFLNNAVLRIHQQGLSSPTKSCDKSSSKLTEYDNILRRSKKHKSGSQDSLEYNTIIPNGKSKQKCIPSKVFHEQASQLDLNSMPQQPTSSLEDNMLSTELLRLIARVKKAQGKGSSLHRVTLRTKYPPLFKKMVVESIGEFENQTAAAAHHNVPQSRLSTWVQQYIKNDGNMDCWNYIEERNKFKREVIEWHQTHGCDLDLTGTTFHVHPITLSRWLKEEEPTSVIESHTSSDAPTSSLRVAHYSDDLKREVVEYYQKSQLSQDKVSRLLGLPLGMISRWQKKLAAEKELEQDDLPVHPELINQHFTKPSEKRRPRIYKSKKTKIQP
ncbi:hypothetical protein DFH28DRAFT_358197 [Melampsora americana]|nr:hypothetical protein DFH28DRAFT_358197 [Melampsora americana]